jgi:hypothetical protein
MSDRIYLGFKAYDIHELLCHVVAETGGFYQQADLEPGLIDTTFLPDEALPENTFQVACAAALSGFLSGKDLKVILVACDRPMFWLYGRPGIDSIDQLANGKVAAYIDNTPPAKFLQHMLHTADIEAESLPARDDRARLAMLTSGSVDGALLSSCYLPVEIARHHCLPLGFVGDHIRVPSTGLAASGQLLEQKPELASSLVGVYQKALLAIFDEDQTLLRKSLMDKFNIASTDLALAVKTIRSCYVSEGRSDETLLQSAMDLVAGDMGLPTRNFEALYDFCWL